MRPWFSWGQARGELLQCLHFAYFKVLGDPLKNGSPTHCCANQFSGGFWTLYGAQSAMYKVKRNGKAAEDSIQMDRASDGSKLFKGNN